MPTKLLVIGSGAIGVEFASFYNDMGAEVTIVEMLDRIRRFWCRVNRRSRSSRGIGWRLLRLTG